MRKHTAPQDKRQSTNYSLKQKVIEEIHEKAELVGQSDSFYLNELLEKQFGFSSL